MYTYDTEDYQDILDGLITMGIKPYRNKGLALFLEAYLKHLQDIPPFKESGLAMIFIYRKEDQPKQYQKYDGMTFAHRSGPEDRARLYSIGLTDVAILKGRDYCLALFLHEYAHILRRSVKLHDAIYMAIRDSLITRHNVATGDHLKVI